MAEPSNQERRAARDRVADVYQTSLAELLSYVAVAVDSYRQGQLSIADTDSRIHRYHRATRELWKFCYSTGDVEFVDATIQQLAEPISWWQRSEPRRPK